MQKKNRYQRAKAHRPPVKPKRRKCPTPQKEPVVVAAWKDAMKAGTFFTPKHDPANIFTPDPQWLKTGRSVFTANAEQNWVPFIDSRDYDLVHYDQPLRTIPGSGLLTVTPHNTKYIDVPGSGIPPKVMNPTHPLDTFVIVWGPKRGWHLYTESSTNIAAQVTAGSLVSGRKL